MNKKNIFDDILYKPVLFFMVLILGSIAVIGITNMSAALEKSVAEFFEDAGDQITDFEFSELFKNTFNDREAEMQWFSTIKTKRDSLLNPPQVMLGAYDSKAKSNFRSILRLEDTVGANLPIMQVYVSWGSDEENKFPGNRVKNILNLGSIPLITWEPWLDNFSVVQYPDIKPQKTRSKHGLADVADGFYDRYIIDWAKDVKAVKYPVFIRLGHEMNDPFRYPWGPHNNEPYEYIAAWKHVHKVFREQNVDNVIWVWCPHVSYLGYEKYYPGHEYVDYIGFNILNYGEGMEWSDWHSFDELFGLHYRHFEPYNKPMMIAEFGTLEYGGEREAWFREALTDFPEKYPLVKSLLFFHVHNDKTAMLKTFDWYFTDDSLCTDAIHSALQTW